MAVLYDHTRRCDNCFNVGITVHNFRHFLWKAVLSAVNTESGRISWLKFLRKSYRENFKPWLLSHEVYRPLDGREAEANTLQVISLSLHASATMIVFLLGFSEKPLCWYVACTVCNLRAEGVKMFKISNIHICFSQISGKILRKPTKWKSAPLLIPESWIQLVPSGSFTSALLFAHLESLLVHR